MKYFIVNESGKASSQNEMEQRDEAGNYFQYRDPMVPVAGSFVPNFPLLPAPASAQLTSTATFAPAPAPLSQPVGATFVPPLPRPTTYPPIQTMPALFGPPALAHGSGSSSASSASSNQWANPASGLTDSPGSSSAISMGGAHFAQSGGSTHSSNAPMMYHPPVFPTGTADLAYITPQVMPPGEGFSQDGLMAQSSNAPLSTVYHPAAFPSSTAQPAPAPSAMNGSALARLKELAPGLDLSTFAPEVQHAINQLTQQQQQQEPQQRQPQQQQQQQQLMSQPQTTGPIGLPARETLLPPQPTRDQPFDSSGLSPPFFAPYKYVGKRERKRCKLDLAADLVDSAPSAGPVEAVQGEQASPQASQNISASHQGQPLVSQKSDSSSSSSAGVVMAHNIVPAEFTGHALHHFVFPKSPGIMKSKGVVSRPGQVSSFTGKDFPLSLFTEAVMLLKSFNMSEQQDAALQARFDQMPDDLAQVFACVLTASPEVVLTLLGKHEARVVSHLLQRLAGLGCDAIVHVLCDNMVSLANQIVGSVSFTQVYPHASVDQKRALAIAAIDLDLGRLAMLAQGNFVVSCILETQLSNGMFDTINKLYFKNAKFIAHIGINRFGSHVLASYVKAISDEQFVSVLPVLVDARVLKALGGSTAGHYPLTSIFCRIHDISISSPPLITTGSSHSEVLHGKITMTTTTAVTSNNDSQQQDATPSQHHGAVQWSSQPTLPAKQLWPESNSGATTASPFGFTHAAMQAYTSEMKQWLKANMAILLNNVRRLWKVADVDSTRRMIISSMDGIQMYISGQSGPTASLAIESALTSGPWDLTNELVYQSTFIEEASKVMVVTDAQSRIQQPVRERANNSLYRHSSQDNTVWSELHPFDGAEREM